MKTSPTLVQAFAPTGRLRAAINIGNPILAGRDGDAERPIGVSVDLADRLGRELGLEVDTVVFDTAAKSVEGVRQGKADVGFFAIDPLRSEGIAFTAPYVLIEGSYLVAENSALQANEEVDRAGTRVVVGKGSAYDLFLSRELKSAEIVRAPTSPAVVEVFVQQKCEVAAGVRQQLEAEAQRFPGHRLLPGRFMVIQQAMGLSSDRGEEAAAFLAEFIEQYKASGFVAQALMRHGIQGAGVAPPAAGR